MSPQVGKLFHSLLMLLALVVSYWLYRKSRQKLELSDDHRSFLSLAALLGAFIGAKLPFLLERDWTGLSPWTHWLSDGKTVLGGIFGGYVAVELTKAWLGVRQGTGDAFAVPIAAGLSIGRIGCFLGGCCFGIPTALPWGVAFKTAPDGGELLRHPVQLYETLFHSTALLVLVMFEYHRWFEGQRLKLYLIGYLVYRFITEWIRPEPRVLFELTAYQIASAFLAILLIVQLRWSMRGSR